MKIDVTYELAKTVRGTLAKHDWTMQRLAESMNEPYENVRRRTVGKNYEFSATELVEIAEIIGAPAWELLPDFMLPCPKATPLPGATQAVATPVDVTYELAKTVRGTLAKHDWTAQRLAESMNVKFETVHRRLVGKKYEFSATELVEIAEIIGAPAWELLPDFMLPCPKVDLFSGAVQIDLLNVDAGTPTGEPEP